MHFCDGWKNQDKKKVFTWCFFFPSIHLILSCVHTALKTTPPSWSQDAATTIKAALTDRSLSNTNVTCSQDCHTLVSDLPQHTMCSPCWFWHHAQEVTPPVLLQQIWACRARMGVLSPRPLVLVSVPRGWLWEPSAWCAVWSDCSWGEGGQHPKDATDATCFLRHTTAVAFCYFLLIQYMFSGNRNCLRPVTGRGFSVPCFLITGNGRRQVLVMEVLPPKSMFAQL